MTNKKQWQERFGKKFPHKIAEVVDDFGSTVKQDISQFIQQEIDLAIAEERKQFIQEQIERLEEEKPQRKTDEETHHTYNDGKRDCIEDQIAHYKELLINLE